MLRKSLLVFALIGLCFLSYCTSAKDINEEDIKNSIKSILDKTLIAYEERNAEKYMELYARSASLRIIEENTIKNGWEAVYESYKKSLSMINEVQIIKVTLSSHDIKVLSEDLALVFIKFETQLDDKIYKNMATLIFQKINSEWKVIHDHTS